MRIISDFHDYYDIGLSYGIDPKCIYNRKEIELAINEETNTELARFLYKDRLIVSLARAYYLEPVPTVILFCGKLFINWQICDKNNPDKSINIYDKDYITNYFIEHRPGYYSKKYWPIDIRKNMEKRYNLLDRLNSSTELIQINRSINAPIALLEYHSKFTTVIINPQLSKYDFQKIYDPYTAFQELSLFIPAYLKNEPETIDISDKDKAKQHGYNKHSFRHPVKM